jgi:iron complex outermembrane recepter protein
MLLLPPFSLHRRLSAAARCFLSVGSVLAAVIFLSAQLSAADPTNGVIAGRVANSATGRQLEGATVEIPALHLKTLTDETGAFSFGDVPPGTHTVVVSYTGLDTFQKMIEIARGQRVGHQFELTSQMYELGKLVVTGEREGNAASITRQHNAPNVVNVVSMDAYGNVADGNIGNFMQRLPGVGAIIENGDIVGFGVRGTPSELNAVNVDGVRGSNAYGGANPQGDRAVVVDAIPSEFIKDIELIKALTPDLPADSIGGTTNLITKSAFDFKDTVFTYRAGGNLNTYRKDDRKWTPTGAFSYMTKLGAGEHVGLALSSSYTETTNTRDRIQMTRNFDDGRNTQARTLNDKATRTRGGIGTKVDFRPNDRFDFYFSGQYSYFSFQQVRTDWNISAGNTAVADYNVVGWAQIEAGTAPRTTANAAAGVSPGFTDSFTEMLNATFVNTDGGTARHGLTYKYDIGGTLKLPAEQKLSFQASYNPSDYNFVFQYIESRRTGGFGMAIDTTGNRDRPVYRQTYGTTVSYGADLRAYTALRAVNNETSEEEVGNARLDYEKVLAPSIAKIELKTGLKWRSQHRTLSVFQPRWNFVGPTGNASAPEASIAQFRRADPGYGLFNNQYPQRDQLDYPLFLKTFQANPSWFRESGTTVSAGPAFNEITEDVSAAYAMARATQGKFSMLGGVRFEETEVTATGRVTDPNRSNLKLTTRDGNYRDFFPSLHFRYDATKGLALRASYSTGSARPAFSDVYPVTTVTYNTSTGLGQVKQSDPGLHPQMSDNYDVAVEYYFEPVGLVSASYFYKKLTDFISAETRLIESGTNNGFDGNYAGFELVTTRNYGSATIEGYELNYNQQLRMLPGFLKNISVFANYTRIDTSGSYANGTAELVRFIPETANTGISSRLGRLSLRAAYNYKSGYLMTYNAAVFARQRVRDVETWDFNVQYTCSPKLNLFVDVVNAFNKWASWYTGNDPGRVIMSEVYGTRITVGVSGRF